MAEGDLELAVRGCVKARLKAKGYKEPFDLDGTMGGAYQYSAPLMIAFHSKVQACLAQKHFKYKYDKTNDYLAKTLAMKLREIYVEIEFRSEGPDLPAITASDQAGLTANPSFAGAAIAPTEGASKKQARKQGKAAKRVAKKPAKTSARKNSGKVIPTAKKAKRKPKGKPNKS
jgi:hypothetical protein